MSQVTATLVVAFKSEQSVTGVDAGLLIAEIDSRPSGLNLGRTQFIPGDEVGYLIYKSNKVGALTHTPSLGKIENLGTLVQQSKTEQVIFSNSDEATTRFPVKKNFQSRWIGSDGGLISVVDERTLKLNSVFTGAVDITYTTEFSEHKVISIPTEVNGKSSFPLVVSIKG